MKITQQGNILSFYIPKDLFDEGVLFKCFYWYTGKYCVTISKVSKGHFVNIETKSGEAIDNLISKIKRDLVDFKLRDIVTKETKVIRELLVAKAFAFDNSEDVPITSVTDPVGFNPLEL